MGAVGLLFVGAMLFVNAIMLLGRVDHRRDPGLSHPWRMVEPGQHGARGGVGIGAAAVFAALAVMTIQRPRMVPATPSGLAGDLTAGQPQ